MEWNVKGGKASDMTELSMCVCLCVCVCVFVFGCVSIKESVTENQSSYLGSSVRVDLHNKHESSHSHQE